MQSKSTLAAIARRFDKLALDQLRAECARLAAENDDLRDRLHDTEGNLDFWWRTATDLTTDLMDAGQQVGMTPCGQIGVIAPQGVA